MTGRVPRSRHPVRARRQAVCDSPQARAMPWLLPGPLLVAAAVAGPDLHRGSVRGARAGHVQAEPGPAADDRPVGVEVPQLVGATGAGRYIHPGARGRGVAGDIEALAAVDLQLAARQVGPLLVRAAVAVPDLQQGPVGRGQAGHVQAAVRADAAQHPGAGTGTAATGVVADSPAVLEPVEPGLVGEAYGPVAVEGRDRAGGVLAGARSRRLGGPLDPGPQDRAHAHAADGVGDRVEVGDVVGAVPGAVVVDAGGHGDPELGHDGTACVTAQVALEVADPDRKSTRLNS